MITQLRQSLARVTPVPLLLRGLIYLAGWAGLLLALPVSARTPSAVLVLAVFAASAALAPASPMPAVVMLVTGGWWVTATAGFGEPVELGRVFGIAATMYLTHAAAALAAVLPTDAIVDATVLLRWAARCGLVLAAAGVIMALVAFVVPALGPGVPPEAALAAGLLLAVAGVTLLARMGRSARRSWED